MQRYVKLEVHSGLATVESRSPDVEVEVRDYDMAEIDDHGDQVSDCTVQLYEAEVVPGPFCPKDGVPLHKQAEVDKLTYYDCPSCDGWTYDDSDGAYYAGIPDWALERAWIAAAKPPREPQR